MLGLDYPSLSGSYEPSVFNKCETGSLNNGWGGIFISRFSKGFRNQKVLGKMQV